MITLRIIDANNNNYFPQKVENLSFKNIHYGGNSDLNFKLNEDPSFQNHKINLFNNIYLYNFSTLVWSGYITEFQRDYKNLNYNLRASGLLIDFQNKRIKKTYVLDDIGEFRNWNEKDNKQSDEILYGYSQATDEKGVKISLLQRNYVAEEDGLFELKIDENIERLKARIFISQPANFTTKLVTLDENHSNPDEEKKWENAQKVDEDVILDITKEATGSGTFTKDIYFNKDSNTFENQPNTNYGNSATLLVFKYPGWSSKSFLEINTGDLPPVDEIKEVILHIYLGTWNFNGIHSLHRITAAWTELGITWNNEPAVSDLINSFDVTGAGWYSVDITEACKNWKSGVWTNYGLRIWTSVVGMYANYFDSSDATTNKPYVKVKYSASTGAVEVNKRYLQFRIECTGAANITTDKYFAQLENFKLLTSDNEINAANILKDLLINHTQKLDKNTSLIQDCFNYKDIELCESLTNWSVSEAVGLTLFLESSIVKEGLKSIKTIVDKGIYSFDFPYDDGKWTLSNATISGGILDITVAAGYGQRSPDANWLSGSANDFIIEVDWKMDSDANYGMQLLIWLVGEALSISGYVRGAAEDRQELYYGGTLKASGAFNPVAGTWYTARVRRVGTTYYFRADSSLAEVSWDYGTARALNYIQLLMGNCTGEFDNFKYSYKSSQGEYLQKILSPTQNLQNKNLLRLWIRSTITGDILKAKFGENERIRNEPDWSCKYEANQKPQNADPVWALTGTDYGSVSGGILTINKTGANECVYTRADVGHNVKGNTIIARMKCTNTAKTTTLTIYDGVAKVLLAIYSTKIEDYNDAANVYTVDMTKWRELWLTMKNNFWILYVDGVFALVGETQTTAVKYFQFGMDSSGNLGKSYWDYVYYYNLGFLRNKRIEKIINVTSNIYEDDFTSDNGKWNLSNAVITGEVLDITAIGGYGERSPDADWAAGANDDFIIEVDFKADAINVVQIDILIYLVGDASPIYNYVSGNLNKMYMWYTPSTRAIGDYTDDTNWHTAKIRRVGTVYYFKIDSGDEISWDYGTARALNYIILKMRSCTGEYDNFKYYYKSAWQEIIIDLNNFPIATRDAIKYIQFEVLTNDAFTFYIDWIRSNFELTSAYYRDRTAPLNILEDVLAYQDYEWTITKDRKVKFFEVDRNEIDYICPIKNLVFEENSTSYFSKIYLVYFDAMMKRQEIELTDENSKIPFIREHVIGLGGISDVGAKAIGEAQFSFHKKPRYQLDCLVDNFVFDKNGGRINPIEIEPNKNIKFLGIPKLPIFRIISTDYSNDVCRLTLETEEESLPNITKTIIEMF